MERKREPGTLILRPRKSRRVIAHTRVPCSISVTDSDELVYVTAERGHLGVMLSELDELGRMICRCCVESKRVVQFRDVIYMPPSINACQNECLKKLWMQSSTLVDP